MGGDADAAFFARQDTRFSGAYRAVHGERIGTLSMWIMLD
jgi:hypothetical protein